MNKLQPIETAPKDGTRVLLFGPDRFETLSGSTDEKPNYYIGYFNDIQMEWVTLVGNAFAHGVFYGCDASDAKTDAEKELFDFFHRVDPTHWMPLPEPLEKTNEKTSNR